MNDERKTELAQLINEATQHRLSMTEALVLIDKLAAGGWLVPEDSNLAVDGPEFDAAVKAEISRSETANDRPALQPHPAIAQYKPQGAAEPKVDHYTWPGKVEPVMEGDDVPDEDAVV
jgi:hypothetical protein